MEKRTQLKGILLHNLWMDTYNVYHSTADYIRTLTELYVSSSTGVNFFLSHFLSEIFWVWLLFFLLFMKQYCINGKGILWKVEHYYKCSDVFMIITTGN